MIFEFQGYQIGYIKFGDGPHPLLAFHGFGQQAEVFYNLEAALEQTFTVYSFHLFHHGNSRYPAGVSKSEPITPEFHQAWVEAFLQKEGIEKFSLMGYSLGGRIVLQTLQQMPERIQSLILLAPDGIKKSFWYHYATQNPRGKILFKRTVERPELFFRLVKYLRMMGFVSKKMEKFTHAQFGDREKREKVLHVWNAYSLLVPRVGISKQIIREYKIPVALFTGKYDPVLNSEIGAILHKGMEDLVTWKVLETGHDLLKPVYCEAIYPVLAERIFPVLSKNASSNSPSAGDNSAI